MADDPRDLVPMALRDPSLLATWPASTIGLLVRQARAGGLLGRLAQGFERAPPNKALQSAAAHASAASAVALAQREEIAVELGHIERALLPLGAPVIVLKGAAYVMAGLPAAQGRVFSDVDILVPKTALRTAEALLNVAGWQTTHDNAYDQRYYRDWMHELPPMEHRARGTTLDVHHSITPETSRFRLDASALIAASVGLPGHSVLRVLAPADMVLHSATHLFLNDEFSHALRDLSDLDILMRHFAASDATFWPTLAERARQMGLERLIAYAIRHVVRVFAAPVPADVAASLAPAAPRWPLSALMDALYARVIRSPHPTARLGMTRAAELMLLARGHWIRMPPALLIRHLSTKALRLHMRGRSDDAAP